METNENSGYVILMLEILGWILCIFLKIKIPKHLRGLLLGASPIPQFANIAQFIHGILFFHEKHYRIFFLKCYLFIWLHQIFVAAQGIFVTKHGIFHCGTRALHCHVRAPEHRGSVVAARGLSSCGTWALEHAGSVVAVRTCLVAPEHVGS